MKHKIEPAYMEGIR